MPVYYDKCPKKRLPIVYTEPFNANASAILLSSTSNSSKRTDSIGSQNSSMIAENMKAKMIPTTFISLKKSLYGI